MFMTKAMQTASRNADKLSSVLKEATKVKASQPDFVFKMFIWRY